MIVCILSLWHCNHHADDKLSTLLELENELGTPAEYTPALDDVLSYFETVE